MCKLKKIMNKHPYIIALDMGTSSCRACAVDAQGKIRAWQAAPLAPARSKEGGSYYHADDLLSAQQQVIDFVIREVGVQNVSALAVSSQRSTVVLWDKRTGQVLAPVLTWEDGRAALQSARAPLSQTEIHQITGLYNTPYFSAPKIAWCIEQLPDVKNALKNGTLCAGPIASFLIFHWTKGAVFAVDNTLAQRTLLFDIHRGQWSEKLCNAFGVPPEILPALQTSVADYGTYNYNGKEIPIRVCAADQQAAACALAEGQTRINYGTGAFVLRHTGNLLRVCDGLLTSPAVSRPHHSKEFLLEGPITSAGSAFMWLAKHKGILIDMPKLDELCQASTQPVQFLPAIGGLGAPYWNFTVSPQAEGVNAQTSPADWAAGLVRAIAFLVADIAAYLRAENLPLTREVFVSGGLSNCRYLVQFQADILQKELTLQTEAEATLLGLARLAWGDFSGEQATQIRPQISADEAARLHRAWQVFVQRSLENLPPR